MQGGGGHTDGGTIGRAPAVRRRIRGKTAAANCNDYYARAADHTAITEAGSPAGAIEEATATGGDNGLVTREVAAAMRRKITKEMATARAAIKRRRTEAWRTLVRDTGTASVVIDSEGWGENVEPAEAPSYHATHDLATARGLEIAYCRRCGAWSHMLGRRPRMLAKECRGREGMIRSNRRSTIRLLELGIYPSADARIPKQFKVGRRGSRS